MNEFRDDPYRAPTSTDFQTPGLTGAVEKLPGFAKVMIIIDLVFSIIRLCMVPFSVLGWITIRDNDPGNAILPTLPFECATSAGMALLGIIGDGLLLAKNKVGIPLAWAKVLFTFASVGVGVWQASYITQQFPDGSPERMGAYVGVGIVTVFRLVLIGLFITAILMAARYFAARDNNESFGG